MPMRRAAKYKRISRDREGRQLGIQRQDEDLDALTERRNLLVVGDYFDNDLSASVHAKKPRKDYQRLLADARAGKFEVIIAYTTGRLTRKPREFEDLIDLAVEHGIEFEYVRSPSFDLRTAQGREIARTMAARDAGEAEELAERVQREKVQAAANGEWRGGRRPYGYGIQIGTKKAYDRKTDEWVERPLYDCYQLVEDEADEIRRATREVILGASLRSLATDMNARGKQTSTGRRWTATELRKVLRRGRNAGLIEVTQEDGTLMVVEGVEAKWPAIIDEAEWRACLAILDDPDRRTNRSNIARRWLGSGLYVCEVCKGTVKATRAGVHSGAGYMVYRCHRKTDQGKPHVTRRADYTDEIVEKTILRWLSGPKAAARIRRDAGPDVAVLHVQAKALRGRLNEADDMYAAGEIDRRRLSNISKDVQQKLDVVEARIAAAAEADPLTQVVGAADIVAAWRALSIPKQQTIIDLVAEVVLRPGKRGRPPGWTPGEPYFDPETVWIRWR